MGFLRYREKDFLKKLNGKGGPGSVYNEISKVKPILRNLLSDSRRFLLPLNNINIEDGGKFNSDLKKIYNYHSNLLDNYQEFLDEVLKEDVFRGELNVEGLDCISFNLDMGGVEEIDFDVNERLDQIISFANSKSDDETVQKLRNFKKILESNNVLGRLMVFFREYPYQNQ
jgi:hypothetical protein